MTPAIPESTEARAELEQDLIGDKVEIARSFSYKLNAGNYESRDFFCSQKAECHPAHADKVSRALYRFCRSQVMEAVEFELQLRGLRKEKQ